MAKSIEINIKLTIPVELVEKEKLTVEQAYAEFIEPLKTGFSSEIEVSGEAHEI